MKIGGLYKTLKGNIGQIVATASLNHNNEFADDFEFDEYLILCRMLFADGSREWWLNNQLVEVEQKDIDLFEEDSQ